MYKKVLVERQILDGALLLEELDRRGFEVTACFWYDLPDSPRWKLVIAAKIVGHEGQIKAYGRLNKIMDELGISDARVKVALWSPSSAHFKAILERVASRNLIEAGYKSAGADSGLVRDEAYIYRL